MTQRIEAVYEGGVFVPAEAPALHEHERVHLIVETLPTDPLAADVATRRRARIRLDPTLAREIAEAPDLGPNER